MLRFRFFLLLSILFFCLHSSAQNRQAKIDSMVLFLPTAPDSTKVKMINWLFHQYYLSDPVQAEAYVEQMESLAKTNEDHIALISAHHLRMTLYAVQGDWERATPIAFQGIEASKKYGWEKRMAFFYNIIANDYSIQGNLDSAIYYFKEGLNYPSSMRLGILNNLGREYSNNGNFLKAIEYLGMGLAEAKAENKNIQAPLLNNLGLVHEKIGNAEKALEYQREALAFQYNIENKRGQIFAISGILDADIPALEKDTLISTGLEIAESWGDTSLLYLIQAQQAIFLAESGQSTQAIALADQINRGLQQLPSWDDNNVTGYLLQVYALTDRPQQGIKIAQQHLAAAEKRGNQEIAQHTRKYLLDFYQTTQQKDAYFAIANTYYPLQDSLDRIQDQYRLAYLDASLADVDQKREIEQLNADIQARELRRQYLLIGGGCLALLLIGIILFRNRQLRIQENLTRELQSTTQELEKANGELKELDGMKNRFFANVSHELRTPLTLISGPIQRLVKRENLSPKGQQEARVIQRNSRILQRRINEILDLTKMDADQLELDPSSTPLLPFTRRILALFESYADQKGIQLNLKTEITENTWAQLDAKKTETILTNYLHNALKFTPRNGVITLALALQNNQIRWSVQDTGPGIEREESEKVFDRFYQVRQKDHKATGGTGIGLALCKDLAELMQGQVWVESTVGLGSTFFLDLAFEPAQPVDTTNLEPLPLPNSSLVELPSGPINKGNQRILLVEDNYDLQIYLQGLLNDYQVFKADHGQEALDFLAQNQVDLIISDVMMPVMDGLELVQHLKGTPTLAQIPIIMLTARAGLDDKLEGLRVGVDDYMVKPFVEEELQARIENALQRVASREQTDPPSEEERSNQNPAQVWLAEVEQVINNRLPQMDFNLDLVAQDLFISRRQLQRRLKASTGMTPSQYVREIRLHKARTLLESGQYQTVAEVCAAVGLEHQHYFSQQYFKRFGKKPSEYFS